jgi:hypothetical protein
VNHWIVLDLVAHDTWALNDVGSEQAQAFARLREVLAAAPPHRVLSTSNSGTQGLIYTVTGDAEALLQTAREHAPEHGVASFVARTWTADPRTGAQPEVIEVIAPQPSWPRPGYQNDLLERWLEAVAGGAASSPN